MSLHFQTVDNINWMLSSSSLQMMPKARYVSSHRLVYFQAQKIFLKKAKAILKNKIKMLKCFQSGIIMRFCNINSKLQLDTKLVYRLKLLCIELMILNWHKNLYLRTGSVHRAKLHLSSDDDTIRVSEVNYGTLKNFSDCWGSQTTYIIAPWYTTISEITDTFISNQSRT